MKLLIAVALLGLPLLCLWALVASFRASRPGRGALYSVLFLGLLFGNPLANAYLLAPVDSAMQHELFRKAQAALLLGASEARVREVLGKPWKTQQLVITDTTASGPFAALLYAPCKVCMASYGAPFKVYLERGKVQGFRSGTGELERVAPPDQ
jgi:hypothetical protein